MGGGAAVVRVTGHLAGAVVPRRHSENGFDLSLARGCRARRRCPSAWRSGRGRALARTGRGLPRAGCRRTPRCRVAELPLTPEMLVLTAEDLAAVMTA
jgi:hypothetical protein